MKKIISVAVLLVFVLTLTASCIKAPTLIEEVATADELSERLGFTMVVPSTAKYVTLSIIETTTGQARFTFNSFIFTYRGSKLLAEDALHEMGTDFEGETSVEIGNRATVKISSLKDGSRVATWTYNGTNYSLYTQKAVPDDVFSELCDLIIK